jgi:hypothetical protein
MTKNKPFLHRQARPYMQRRVDSLPVHQRFLIVCEGKKTEPFYFQSFRVPGLIVEIDAVGRDTVRVVRRAVKLCEQDDYDQTWCVFDKDDSPEKNFNDAIALAKRNGFRVAYSNQAFELWYVLHFDYMHNAITRDDYMRILDDKLEKEYKKNSPTIYDELIKFQEAAMRNARMLLKEYPRPRPAMDDPSTTVHLLVEQLIKYSKPFGIRDRKNR